MGEVHTSEIPGGMGDAYECPYCSRGYPRRDLEDHEVHCPPTCRRCGSPMDIEASLAFAERKAHEARSPGAVVRPRVRV